MPITEYLIAENPTRTACGFALHMGYSLTTVH